MIRHSLFSILLSLFLVASHAQEQQHDYDFSNGVISQQVLKNYLSRSITQAEFLASDGFYNDGTYPYKDDDIRMLHNIGAKFVGRAVYSWGKETFFQSPAFWENIKKQAAQLHQTDPDMVFQAAIFEIITEKVNEIAVPDWVFRAFSLPAGKRHFDYSHMLNPEGKLVDHWRKGSSVPDIGQTETQLYFYYLACRYMQAGIEALHFGQAELMAIGGRNQAYPAWQSLLAKVRQAALTMARRGTVICDAHLPSGGMAVDGKLLFDFVSFPLRLKELKDEPQKTQLEENYLDGIYGKTKGGITPSGWHTDRSPYLVEFDNFGISRHRDEANWDDIYAWGYDEISWFCKQPEAYRNEFLSYATGWLGTHDPVGSLEMPGSRIITGLETNRYRANNNSSTCPLGKGQEETIKKIWDLL